MDQASAIDNAPCAAAVPKSGTNAAGPERIWLLSQLVGNPFSRSHLAKLVKSGRLPARTSGGGKRILIADSDWRGYLASLPDAAERGRSK